MGDQFYAHQLHLVMHQIASTVAGVSGEDHLGACFSFDGVHHLEGLHLQTFRHLERNQSIVVGANPLHQLIQLKVVAIKVHTPPQSVGGAPPS